MTGAGVLEKIDKTETSIESLAINQIHLGDCLELMKGIPTGSVDMILCDLPYGTTQNKWDNVIDLAGMWEQYSRVIKKNGAIILTAAHPFNAMLIMSNTRMFKYDLVWDKRAVTGHLNAKKMPLRRHEHILVFYKKPPVYNPQMTEGKPYKSTAGRASSNYGKQVEVETINYGTRYPVSVIAIPQPRFKTGHPTQKPVELFEYLIKTYTNEGETILDNCIGSGTTAVAAINTGRNFIGIEMELEYVKMANERINEVVRGQA